MNKYLYNYYDLFNNTPIQWIRVGVFLALGIIVYVNIHNPSAIFFLIPLYFILIIQELFIFTKLNNSLPLNTVKNEKNNILETVDFSTRALLQHNSVLNGLRKIQEKSEVKELIILLGMDIPIQDISISQEELLNKAWELVNELDGKYIHAIDIYTSYLLLADEKNKLLFEKEIERKDIISIVSWLRKQHGYDSLKSHEMNFGGNGVFDSLVYGWSAELSKYALNFTNESIRRENVKPIGRDKEYDLLVTALSKNSSSNALLIGAPGVGKTSLVAQLALDSNAGKLPSFVSHKIIFQLFAERLLAGVENQGDMEARFVSLFEELSHSGNIIVYIPNIENILGGGGMNLDLSGMLSEYLKSNRLTIIGTTTEALYQTYIYPKQELRELFENVQVQEPDNEVLLFMLFEKRKEFMSFNDVQISYDALKEALSLSSSYISDGIALPGRAVKLLEDVITHAKTHGVKTINKSEVRNFVEQKVHIVLSKPTTEESTQLLHLEEEIHKKIVSQEEAVKAISDAMRRVRSGMKDGNRPIASFLFLGPTGVGKTETAKALSSLYFGSEDSMLRLDMSEYQTQDSIERFLGSSNPNEFVDNVGNKILNNPFTLILLDEFEKAHPKILDLFLQILDEGRLTDNTGRTISFTNAIIIATSNAGSELIREKMAHAQITEEERKNLIDTILKTNIFKPELVNRFDDVIVFKPLVHGDIVSIADHFMKEVGNKLSEQHITLRYDKDVLEFIANASYSTEFGARNVRRFIEQTVENQISTKILDQTLPPGGVAIITINSGSIVVTTS